MTKLVDCLAANVERYRKQKYLSQEALGKLIGLSKQAIWNIEHGKTGTSFDTIAKLAKVLDVNETDLTSPPKAVLPGKEFPNEFVEFVREAKKHQEFYHQFIESMSKKMNVQADVMRKIWVKEGILKPEDVTVDEDLDSGLAKVPEFTFPEHESVPEELVQILSDPLIRKAAVLLSSPSLDDTQRRGLVAQIEDVVDVASSLGSSSTVKESKKKSS